MLDDQLLESHANSRDVWLGSAEVSPQEIMSTGGVRYGYRRHKLKDSRLANHGNASPAPLVLPSADWKRSFRRRLLAWYDRHARSLPWRGTRDPYRIWVSEIMLQQTQVPTVEDYYPRFIERFPTVEALAQAAEEEVLRQWEGLGYYRRARALHRAARLIVRDFGGRFPRDAEIVRQLPGIGRYTAGAVLSIAYDEREPILEANTLRLFSRLLGFRGDPRSGEGNRLLWRAAADWLPRRRVGHFNQALMELGSEICTPRGPQCPACPVRSLCRAHEQAIQEQIPPPPPKMRFEVVHEAAVVVRRGARILLQRRADDGRWAGLWDFPRFSITSVRPAALKRELVDKVAASTGVLVEPTGEICTFKHGVTRFRITLHCHEAEYLDGPTRNSKTRRWTRPAELDAYPLNVTGRKLGRLIARAVK